MFAKSHLILAAIAAAMIALLAAPRSQAGIYEELQRSVREYKAHDAPAPRLAKRQITTTNGTFAIKGARERKQVRLAAWNLSLQGDRLRIREEMGYPTYRLYELRSDVRTELWTYPHLDRVYVFRGDTLIETRLD